MGEILFLLLISGASAAYYIETLSYRAPKYDKTGGAAVFPQLILVILIAFCLLRIIMILVKKEGKKHFVFLELFKGTTGVFFLSFLIYVLTMKYIGYIVGTSLFLIWTTSYLRYKAEGSIGSKRTMIIRVVCMVALSIAVSVFFSNLLHVKIPEGIWGSLL